MEKDKFVEDAIDSDPNVTCFILEDFTKEEALEIAQLLMDGVDASIEILRVGETLKEAADMVVEN